MSSPSGKGDAKPEAGKTFVISALEGGFVLTAKGRGVTLENFNPRGDARQRWQCALTKRGYGFKNEDTGLFLGVNRDADICDVQSTQGPWESFIFQPWVSGGYQVIVTFNENRILARSKVPGGSLTGYPDFEIKYRIGLHDI